MSITNTNDQVTALVSKLSSLDFAELVDRACTVLTPKEYTVLKGRFNLTGQGSLTLEAIGIGLHVTRERIRQIEEVSLQKLSRTIKSTDIYLIAQLAKEFVVMSGGVILEHDLVSNILNVLSKEGVVDGQVVRLALAVSDDVNLTYKRGVVSRAWYLSTYNKDDVLNIVNTAYSILENVEDETPMNVNTLVLKTATSLTKKFQTEFIGSTLLVDVRFKMVDKDTIGLIEWRSIHPRSLCDKAKIILQRAQVPLHFTEVTNLINDAKFDHKMAHVAAVHNELIRNSRRGEKTPEVFRLVGRGKYALAMWGMAKGKVRDIIILVLKEANRPLSREEVVNRVMKLREAKPNTIILNLQREPGIIRPSRGLYAHSSYKEEEVEFSVATLDRKAA